MTEKAETVTIDNDIAEELTRTGPPTHKFENVGDTLKLRISAIAKRDQTDFQTGEVLTWPDGKPKVQYEITGTDASGDETRIFAKGQMLAAVKEAFRTAGTKPEVDGELIVKFDRTEPSKTRGFADQKIYKAKYTAPAPSASMDIDDL